MRIDFDVIEEWIADNSRVLDLGCGDGALLLSLKNNKQVDGLGIVVGDVCGFARPRDRIVLVMDQTHQLAPLLVCHLDVLAYHNLRCWPW